MLDAVPPLLVTLALDDTSQAHFDALRQAHFPPARNFLPAHVTLFHHLPGVERVRIEAALAQAAAGQALFPISTTGLWLLGSGVAYLLDAPPLLGIRESLATEWDGWLTPQDRQRGFKPHITVQNKVPAEQAKALFAELEARFVPWRGLAVGLDLWRYLGGPWEFVTRYPFAA